MSPHPNLTLAASSLGGWGALGGSIGGRGALGGGEHWRAGSIGGRGALGVGSIGGWGCMWVGGVHVGWWGALGVRVVVHVGGWGACGLVGCMGVGWVHGGGRGAWGCGMKVGCRDGCSHMKYANHKQAIIMMIHVATWCVDNASCIIFILFDIAKSA